MVYDEKKIEAIKILVPEILELNKRLLGGRIILFEMSGNAPFFEVRFCVRKNGMAVIEKMFVIFLAKANEDLSQNSFSEIGEVMKRWEKLYGKNI